MRVEQVAQAESATAPGVTAASEWCTSRRTIDLSKPALMGVLNITPDSFSDGGLYLDKEAALVRLEELQADGADIVDIGGESTRPGARAVERDEELRRVMPVVEAASERLDVAISIDTTKTSVARAALDAGAEIINDISGLTFDPGLAELAAKCLDQAGPPGLRRGGASIRIRVGVGGGAPPSQTAGAGDRIALPGRTERATDC